MVLEGIQNFVVGVLGQAKLRLRAASILNLFGDLQECIITAPPPDPYPVYAPEQVRHEFSSYHSNITFATVRDMAAQLQIQLPTITYKDVLAQGLYPRRIFMYANDEQETQQKSDFHYNILFI